MSMKIIINGQHVERHIENPELEEIIRVTSAIKDKYGLGWASVSAIFGMTPNANGAMTVKKWRNGSKPMPMGHYFLALQLLGEFKVEVSETK